MDDQERQRYLQVLKVALLAIEAYDPCLHSGCGLSGLVISYGKEIGVTDEEAQVVLYTSRLCDYARR